jgi:hypothetical protein
MSPEQAKAMVWTSGTRDSNEPGNPVESSGESRMFSFEVAQSKEQHEEAIATSGFTVRLLLMNLLSI